MIRSFYKIALFEIPMFYFVVFNKKGIVLHDEGEAPLFINTLIRSLNLAQPESPKPIRDDILEYEVRDQEIFLSINKTPILQSCIKKYETKNKTESIENQEKDAQQPENKSEAKNTKKKGKKEKIEEELNYSESKSTVSTIMESIKKVDFKRTFRIFSNKIDINELGPKMSQHLISKNVDPSFSSVITNDIISEFKDENKDMVNENEFKEKLVNSLSKILPSIDHEKFIENIKSHQGVYSICFVGVNGVGKSTSLAKMACFLLQKGLKVYIAACDTFRAGAIEQLKVHVDRFKVSGHSVGFFESGYSKDDASVAKSAIMRANKENYDVILIDTAGRMHNKDNLMKSLTKLIKFNNPNHILFVGEALVGGDSLDHIREFNKRIAEGVPGRKIDSILLTKIDTVDDKIGQVLNLCFSSSSPVIFLGTGQSNSDLTPMDSKIIAELLAS
jgi:signal recognition particle receptor subunit alpha